MDFEFWVSGFRQKEVSPFGARREDSGASLCLKRDRHLTPAFLVHSFSKRVNHLRATDKPPSHIPHLPRTFTLTIQPGLCTKAPMNVLDGLILAILVFFLIRGIFRGFFKEIGSLAGVILGIVHRKPLSLGDGRISQYIPLVHPISFPDRIRDDLPWNGRWLQPPGFGAEGPYAKGPPWMARPHIGGRPGSFSKESF